jgi:sphinganine C4-monooxygenase
MANTTHWRFDDFLVPQSTSNAQPTTILGVSASTASVIVPIVIYWVTSAFYEAAEYFDWFPAYRTYPSGEEKRRNLVSRWQTLRSVLTMHVVQTVFGFATIYLLPKPEMAPAWDQVGSVAYFGLGLRKHAPVLLSEDPGLLWIASYSLRLLWLSCRQLIAFFLFDTWAYWVHYMEHMVPWLYRTYPLLSVSHFSRLTFSSLKSHGAEFPFFFF